MKPKQLKEDLDKGVEEETKETTEPKTRGRKRNTDTNDEDKSKINSDEPKPSKDNKRHLTKPKAVVRKRPLGIRKTLRSKKVVVVKDKIKTVLKQTGRRGRKPMIKTEPETTQDKETVPLIPISEIKKEPIDELLSISRSSSPKTAGKRQRVTSDMAMMKSVLGDSPTSLVLGPRTSPYSMRSERSNSPSLLESKNLRSGKPRKVKSNLLNEVVMKEQKKRRRLLSDSKASENTDTSEDCKKLKRGRSCSRDGSEISKCSDITESDASLSESFNDPDNKELNKKLEKPKTELDLDIENKLQITTTDKVPSISFDSKLAEVKSTGLNESLNGKNKKKTSLKRSTSLDSDNNNSRLKLDNLNSSDNEDKLTLKIENDTLFEARNSILTSMSKSFNSKEMSKNIRKARRGRKAAAVGRPTPTPAVKNGISSTTTNDMVEDKTDTIDTLSKEINDLINNLDQNIDRDNEAANETPTENVDQFQSKTKFYGVSKPLGDNNIIVAPDTPVKDKDIMSQMINEITPSKNDDSENIRLHYEDSAEKSDGPVRHEITYKCSTVASIDKLMDRLKEFEEFDKRRQRQESELKSNDSKSVMVSSDVVLIPKSGADIKPFKDIQSVKSPEIPIEKENVLSCFENNSAISIVKRDQVRKSIDKDVPNSVTLIKRNSMSARKESTSSNHAKESDAISIFEKSLGKDVTLTEIRKSVDKPQPTTAVDLHQFATLHPNNPTSTLVGVVLDSKQISIMPVVVSESRINYSDIQITKRRSTETLSRKSSESANEADDKMAVIEKIMSPPHQIISSAISIIPTPVSIKSPEVTQPLETEAHAPPLEIVTAVPESTQVTSETPKIHDLTNIAILGNEMGVFSNSKILIDTSVKNNHLNLERSVVPEQIKADKAVDTNIIMPDKIVVEAPILVTEEQKDIPTEIEREKQEIQTLDKFKSVIENQLPPPIGSQLPPAIASIDNQLPTLRDNQLPTLRDNQLPSPIDNQLPPPRDIQLPPPVDDQLLPSRDNQLLPPVDNQMPPSVDSQLIPLVDNQLPPLVDNQLPPPVDNQLPNASNKTKIDELVKVSTDNVDNLPMKDFTENKVSEEPEKDLKPGSSPGPSDVIVETPESQERKENILRTLGLLTHKAAKEAKIEKQKEKERIYGSSYNQMMANKSKSGKIGSTDYTGTLKTVIKLNRSTGERERKKYRSPLKMTFQKSKNRAGRPALEVGETAEEEDAYYTIERKEGATGATSEGGHRKSHYSNRLNNHETEVVPEPVEPSKETLNLVIPEKASSFSIHPGRLCQDQCFYCGGKFGLFDTPCHIAQMKSMERQKKVLDNEEKLTIDSCLCDACYRHVDRRANCPSYRKRPFIKPPAGVPLQPSPLDTSQIDKPISPPLEEESEEDSPVPTLASGRPATCHTEGCLTAADHSIRRKWLIKMRSSVNKVLKLQLDYPGLHTIPLCGEHYRALSALMLCVLCRRRITKHHNVHFIHHGYTELNPLLLDAGIPVQFTDRPVLCKMCRYYCTLLQRPGQDDKQAKLHRRKLLQVHNIVVSPESDNETEETILQEDGVAIKQKKKSRGKSKQRKSSEPEKPGDSESFDSTNENSNEKYKAVEETVETNEEVDLETQEKSQTIDEDIESLISSNKILVPGLTKPNEMVQSDGSDENMFDMETPLLPVDKQTELQYLQYLLQKQNNPAQFTQKDINLTQKQKNTLKIQAISGIQKPGLQQRIADKNAKRLYKIGQIMAQKDKTVKKDDASLEMDIDKPKDGGMAVIRNLSLNEECTIESIPNKKTADINLLKNKWQMSESFSQVKKNLSELSKKLTTDKDIRKSVEIRYTNPVKRLETNPSISVRELFPGEEEMNLQCNIEFNNVKGITPEGWEKCNSTIQYDLETKKLWTELQRPYGNQSSFLRHLVLLEKYFRNGDLILSPHASTNAINYSDSVQIRLRAYDNVLNDTPRRSEPAISLLEFRKKPSMNGKSLLKSSQNEMDKESKKFMPPPGIFPKPKTGKTSEKSKSKPLPPELIAINTPNAQGRKAIQNVLQNIQQLVKGVSASDPIEVASAPLPPPAKPEPFKEKKDIPKLDTPKKKKTTSKPWRPTLLPITPENIAKSRSEPHQVAVDGRRLPSLVKVMSSNEPYYITREDYNKMCIMRREKLQQLQDGSEIKTKKSPAENNTTIVTEIQPSTILGNGGTVVQNIPVDKDAQDKQKELELGQMGNAASILKNVGLKNITIAPIPPKTATITSQTMPTTIVTSPSIVVTSAPMKMPHLGTSVSIIGEPIQKLPISSPIITNPMMMPKIPKSLTVIPQTIITSVPQTAVITSGNAPSQAIIQAIDSQRP